MEDKIIAAALGLLRETESGEIIKLSDLIKETNLANAEILKDSSKMLSLCHEIICKAKKEKMFLESIFGEDAIIGMPYDIPYAVKRKYDKTVFSKENIASVLFKTGGYMCCIPSLLAEAAKDNASDAWDELLNTIINICKVQNWYDSYVDYGILDGYYWGLEIKFSDGTIAKYGGSNKEPKSLRKLERAISRWKKDDFQDITYDENDEDI